MKDTFNWALAGTGGIANKFLEGLKATNGRAVAVVSRSREREKTERRRAILGCARDLILSQGVERVSMEDIARKAELSKATLYLYFHGKELIFHEICEESARIFLDHFKSFLEAGYTGIKALKYFWSSYVKLFGNSDEMIMIFKVRNFLKPGLPFISLEEQSASSVDAVLVTMKTIIDQCKSEGLFDPDLDSDLVTGLLLSLFSSFVDKAARMLTTAGDSTGSRNRQAIIEEMAKNFRVILRGFARQGIDFTCLDFLVT
jgi:AcrR family transcriptional regulator